MNKERRAALRYTLQTLQCRIVELEPLADCLQDILERQRMDAEGKQIEAALSRFEKALDELRSISANLEPLLSE